MYRTVIAVGATLVFLLCASLPAWGQAGQWGLSVGVPVNFKFSKDENTGTAPDAKPVSGSRVMVTLPVNLGIGVARYQSGFADNIWPLSDRVIDYSFLEVQFTIPLTAALFGVGFGLGSAEFTPERTTLGPTNFDMLPSRAREWFLMGGYRITPGFDIHMTMHAIVADAKIRVNGAEGSGAIGATMTTVGVGFHF